MASNQLSRVRFPVLAPILLDGVTVSIFGFEPKGLGSNPSRVAYAGVVELADTAGLDPVAFTGLEVRLLSPVLWRIDRAVMCSVANR